MIDILPSSLSYFLPPILAYLVVAVLAVTPQTHALRVASWPVVAGLAWRAVTSLDTSVDDLTQRFNIIPCVALMYWIVIRALYWTVAKEPLVRHLRPTNGSQSTVMDALDLALTMRGYGWDWSRGVHIQRETRPTNRMGFIFHVILSGVIHTLILGITQKTIRSFFPMATATAGGTIFDETLPFHARYLRATVIVVVTILFIQAFVQVNYDICTLVGVVIFNQEPRQWPPAFNAPFCSTSMSEFWARRWQSFFRHVFLVHGGYPLRFLFGRVGFLGRVGYIVGAFQASILMHYIPMSMLDNRFEFWRLQVGLGMMGLVILAEDLFKMWTGRKVGGVVGWVWTMFWLFLGEYLIVDGFTRPGLFQYSTFLESVVPRPDAVEYVVRSFDSWLHTM